MIGGFKAILKANIEYNIYSGFDSVNKIIDFLNLFDTSYILKPLEIKETTAPIHTALIFHHIDKKILSKVVAGTLKYTLYKSKIRCLPYLQRVGLKLLLSFVLLAQSVIRKTELSFRYDQNALNQNLNPEGNSEFFRI